VYDARRR